MARKYELTWDKHKKRWKKFYKGRQYYLGSGESKTDQAAYQLALDAWRKKKTELDTDRQRTKPRRKDYEAAIKTRQDLATWCRQNGEGEKARIFQAEADKLLSRFNKLDEPPALAADEADPLSSVVNQILHDAGFFSTNEDDPRERQKAQLLNERFAFPEQSYPPVIEARLVWQDRLDRLKTVQPEKTIGAAIDSFLKRQEAKAKSGEVSAGYYAVLHAHLGRFQNWAGHHYPLESIGPKTLLDFHTTLLTLIEEGTISRKYGNDTMKTVRAFVRWCWTLELCGLPRNIDSKDLGFNVGPQRIRIFSKEELASLLSTKYERTRLFVLLALNTGMTQQDIADLRQEEVDWSEGRITRKRSKTKGHDNVPTVSYPLWPQTFKLLRKYRSDDPGLALLNKDGRPLKRETIEGKYNKKDNIGNSYRRVAEKLSISKPFKLIRKTGASKLEEHEVYRGFVRLYLGHAPQTVAERHYAIPSSGLFDKAILWLGEQFELCSSNP